MKRSIPCMLVTILLAILIGVTGSVYAQPHWVSAPWQTTNIGRVGLTGSASQSQDSFTVKGSGTDVWDIHDQFYYVYQPLLHDGQISLRVSELSNTSEWAKAGVMIRNSFRDNAPNVFIAIAVKHGVVAQWRSTTGQITTSKQGPVVAVPQWLRLSRKGDTFTGDTSSDGKSWQTITSVSIAMGTIMYIGMAVTAHNNQQTISTTFDHVVTTGTAVPTPTPTPSPTPTPTMTPTPEPTPESTGFLVGAPEPLISQTDNDLTAEGTRDWAHWGLLNPTSFDHKRGVAPQISNYTHVGNGTYFLSNLGDNTYSWHDGTPDLQISRTPTGVGVRGLKNGFSLTVPADATQRIVRVYAGAYHCYGQFTATLSDNSAPPLLLGTREVPGNDFVFTAIYAANAPQQTLTITYIMQTDLSAGVVSLESATLQVLSSPIG